MINSRVKKAPSDSSSSSSNAPITIQVQVPGANEGSVSNSHLVPQQECPSFSGDCVLNGAFKKISNMVKQKFIVFDNFCNLSLQTFSGKYFVLLFYPLDWTFVCPTEIVEFSDKMEEFQVKASV